MDIASYRRAEALARQSATSWRLEQAHYPVTFAALGFPIRVESTADLLQLTDMFQEGRAERYQAECGGLSAEDFEGICKALTGWARWAAQTFHVKRAPLPLDTMLSAWALFEKFCRWVPDFDNVLEIGPGCGYLAWFMRRRPATRYVQVEATESLYHLQALVNARCFGRAVKDFAAMTPNTEGLEISSVGAQCHHVPWWAIDEARKRPYDIITSNANLREFSAAALAQYAKLIGDTLTAHGALIVQCLGDGAISRGEVLSVLKQAGLKLIFAGGPGVDRRPFAVGNYLFVRESSVLEHGDPRIADVYAMRPGERRVYLKSAFEAHVTEMLNG